MVSPVSDESPPVQIEWNAHLYPQRDPRLTVLGPRTAWSMSWGRKPHDLRRFTATVSRRYLKISLHPSGWMWVEAGKNAVILVTDQSTGETRRIYHGDKGVRIEFLGVKVGVDVDVPGHGTIFSATFVTPVPDGRRPTTTSGLTRSAYDIEALLQMMGEQLARGDDPTRAREALLTLLAHTLHRNREALGVDEEFQGLWDLGIEIMGDRDTVPKKDQRVRHSKEKQLALTRDKDGVRKLAAFLARTDRDVSQAQSDAARDFILTTVRSDPDAWITMREQWLEGQQ